MKQLIYLKLLVSIDELFHAERLYAGWREERGGEFIARIRREIRKGL